MTEQNYVKTIAPSCYGSQYNCFLTHLLGHLKTLPYVLHTFSFSKLITKNNCSYSYTIAAVHSKNVVFQLKCFKICSQPDLQSPPGISTIPQDLQTIDIYY